MATGPRLWPLFPLFPMPTQYLEVRVPFRGYTTVEVVTTTPQSEDDVIEAAKAADAYPNLKQGVLEYEWESASVHELPSPIQH